MSIGQSVTPGIRRAGPDRDLREVFRRLDELDRVAHATLEDIPDQVTYSLEGPRGIQISLSDHPATSDLGEELNFTAGASAVIQTNDNQDPVFSGTLTIEPDPFTGQCFKVDWDTDPTVAVTLLRSGLYHFEAIWAFGGSSVLLPEDFPPFIHSGALNGIFNLGVASRYFPDYSYWITNYGASPNLVLTHLAAFDAAVIAAGAEVRAYAFSDQDSWDTVDLQLNVWRVGDWAGLTETIFGSGGS